MDTVIYLLGGIIPCRPWVEDSRLRRGSAAPTPEKAADQNCLPAYGCSAVDQGDEKKGDHCCGRPQRLRTEVINTRDETRTRKTRRSGDFESPASTNSATRALTQCSGPACGAQRVTVSRLPLPPGQESGKWRSAPARPECARPTLAVLAVLTKLFHSTSKVILDGEVLGPLHGRHECG